MMKNNEIYDGDNDTEEEATNDISNWYITLDIHRTDECNNGIDDSDATARHPGGGGNDRYITYTWVGENFTTISGDGTIIRPRQASGRFSKGDVYFKPRNQLMGGRQKVRPQEKYLSPLF